MKKLFFFFFAVFLFYFAAIYQYSALMILAVGQQLLLLLLSVQTHICRSRLKTAFTRKNVASVKGRELSCEIAVDYQGKLPAGCLKFYMTQGYGSGQKKVGLYGNNNSGRAAFTVKSEYCGIKNIYLKKIRIYDYLFLSSVKKAVSDQMQVAVFPREQTLDIRISDMVKSEYSRENLPESSNREMSGEIRQIREYREGDSKRQFHWKLSARMDTMLVKEYEKETENVMKLFLNLSGYDMASLQERDAFYTLLSALLLGLLQEQERVDVCWQEDDEGDMVKMKVTEPARCREALMRLYCLGEGRRNKERKSGQGQVSGKSRMPGQKQMPEREQMMMPVNEENLMLDIKLCLYQGTKLLCRFAGEHLEDEIQGKQIVIVRGA